MKKIIVICTALALVFQVRAQEPAVSVPEGPEAAPSSEEIPAADYSDTIRVMNRIEVIETSDNTRVALGKNEVIIVEENGDTVIVGLGSKGISITEDEDGSPEIKVFDMEKDSGHRSHRKKRKFDPNWAGLEIGLNNYLTPDYNMVLPPAEEFMDLNTGLSWNWNLNVFDFGIGFGSDKIGLVTGLGFEFINYHFDGQNSIMKDTVTGNIVTYEPEYANNITKSKMNIAYITAPLLLEWQIPAGNGRLHFSAGVIGGLKMWSNTKLKYMDDGSKKKEKNKNDYNLSPLRWGLTARAGYKELSIFANYYMTSLFKPDRGPELYPFTIGLAFTPN